jgi:hypothetical protein
VDAKDDDVAHEIALVLTEASQRGGSPQISRTPNRKTKGATLSPVQNGEKMVTFCLTVSFAFSLSTLR